MADRYKMYKGIALRIQASELSPNVEYYAILRDDSTGAFISTPLTISGTDGRASFTFDYTKTNNVRDNALLSLLIFDRDRTQIPIVNNRLIQALPTSLTDEKDVTKYEIKEI